MKYNKDVMEFHIFYNFWVHFFGFKFKVYLIMFFVTTFFLYVVDYDGFLIFFLFAFFHFLLLDFIKKVPKFEKGVKCLPKKTKKFVKTAKKFKN